MEYHEVIDYPRRWRVVAVLRSEENKNEEIYMLWCRDVTEAVAIQSVCQLMTHNFPNLIRVNVLPEGGR